MFDRHINQLDEQLHCSFLLNNRKTSDTSQMLRLWYSRYLASACLRCRPLLISEQPAARLYQPLLRRTVNTDANVQRPNDFVPLRKQLKEEAKRAKTQSRNGRGKKQVAANDQWELTVGIEIHAQLNSEAKLFSSPYTVPRLYGWVNWRGIAGAPTSTVAEPNTNVALFDLAFPGSQPVCHWSYCLIIEDRTDASFPVRSFKPLLYFLHFALR